MILPITLTIAAAAALIHVWLSVRVSHVRRLHHISIGDEGNRTVATRMRAHGNFAENVPIFLILLGLIEHGVGSELWLWIVAAIYILARLMHAFGMDRPAPNFLRIAGVSLSWLLLLGLAGFGLYLAYTEQSNRRALDAPQMHRA
ncbi:MAG TPA: MAPEG family protein [Allosphingosinicella sp.]|jgi:hypothetical protein